MKQFEDLIQRAFAWKDTLRDLIAKHHLSPALSPKLRLADLAVGYQEAGALGSFRALGISDSRGRSPHHFLQQFWCKLIAGGLLNIAAGHGPAVLTQGDLDIASILVIRKF